jgi:hypothetical protein
VLNVLFLQVLFSVPWAVASELTTQEDGGGQGLAIGVLNIAIVMPQVEKKETLLFRAPRLLICVCTLVITCNLFLSSSLSPSPLVR